MSNRYFCDICQCEIFGILDGTTYIRSKEYALNPNGMFVAIISGGLASPANPKSDGDPNLSGSIIRAFENKPRYEIPGKGAVNIGPAMICPVCLQEILKSGSEVTVNK